MSAAKKKSTPVIETKALPIGGRMLALEPRYVFDAAISTELHDLSTADAISHDSDTAHADVGSSVVAASRELAGFAAHQSDETTIDRATEMLVRAHNLAPSNHEIAFIDSRLADLGTLINSIPDGTRIVLIDGARDGVAQMVDALKGEQGITGIHILSHGSDGHIQLGASSIDEATMSSVYRSALSSIHGNLAAGADILVYGCDFGAGVAGARAASMLADLTGADVASSIDLTGAADKGGDWVLEKSTGAIETAGVASVKYSGLLSPVTVTPVDGTTTTAMTVAQTLLGSNISIVSATLGGQNSQAGVFSSASGSTPPWIAFDSGVVFSSGNASSLTTSNTADNSSTGITSSTGGSADFSLVGGGTSYNASYIDITFVPTTNRIALQFVFGSDEYNEYVYAAVNDAIGMWVNGVNIAVTPAGAPIGIDTINQAATYNPRFGSQTRDPNSANGVFDSAAPSLYVNNDPKIDAGETGPGALYATSMDGFTRTLGATITVNPGVNNTIRLGVADIGDGVYDSWLLVKADSVQSNLIAQNDSVGTTLNTPVTFSPLANDIDFDSDPIQITNVVDQPISVGGTVTLLSGGTVTLNADKTFTYTPPLGSTAPELFTYSTTDGNGNTATAYVTVNIVTGTPPTLDLDASAAGTGYAAAYTVGGSSVAIADLDSAITDTGNITKASIGITNAFSGDQLTVNPALLPAGVSIDPSSTATNIVLVGNVSPAVFADAIEQIQFSNSSGSVNATDRNIAVQVTDANGLSSNVAISTIAINNAPAFTDPDVGPTTPYIDPTNPANLIVPASDGTLVSIDLDTYYADPNGDAMTVTPDLTGLPAWLSYNPATHVFTGTPPVDNTGTDVVIPVTVTDVHGATFVSTVTIHPVNPGPVANADSTPTVQGNAVIVDLLANDSDPDGDAISISGTPTVPAAQGTMSLVGGNWVFTPAVGFSGNATISYTIVDADGATSSSTHTVVVAPLAAVDDAYTTAYTTPLHGDASTLDAFPIGSIFSTATLPAHGSVTMGADGKYVYTPAAGFAGTDTFRYIITDPSGNQVTATETITVTPPMLAAVDDSYTTGFRTPLQGNAATADTFASGSTFAVTTPPVSGTLVMNANGTYTYTPATNFAGTVTFTYRITDPTGQVATAIDTIVVSRPLLVAADDTYTSGYGKVLNGNAAGGDAYATGSTFAVASNPAMGTVTMNANGTFRYVPRPGFSGTDTFTYTITDPTGQTITATERITVESRPPLHRCLTTFGRITGFVRRR